MCKQLLDKAAALLRRVNKKKVLQVAVYDSLGALLMGISVVVFAVQANFAPGGISGLGVLVNYLFHFPIGMAIICINVPIILLTFRRLGVGFFINSVRSMVVSSLFIDYVVCWLPVFTGSRWMASILSGICAGIGYALFFYEGSSTGGTDFIMVSIQRWKPNLTLGFLAFLIDSTVIVLAVFVFRDIWAFVYGMVYTVVTSLFLDMGTAMLSRYVPKPGEVIFAEQQEVT